MRTDAHKIIEGWIAKQFQIHEERKRLRRYMMCCYAVATDKLTEGDPILDYDMGMSLCCPADNAFPGLIHWLEPVF